MLGEERIDGCYLIGQRSGDRQCQSIARSDLVLDQLQQAFSNP